MTDIGKMSITINNRSIEILQEDKTLIEIAGRAKIGIPAPCYRSQNSGCCKACVVEINGSYGYACCTKPVDGMTVVTNRNDIKAIQKERLEIYRQNLNDPAYVESCDCGCDCNPNGSESDCC